MKQEDKAKRYDELLLKLQKAKVDDNVCDEMYYRVIDDIVPELKESEDEKILRHLKAVVKEYDMWTERGLSMNDVLAWLEKQKEFVSADFDDVWETADCEELTAPLEKYSKEAIKKMCHAWYDKGIELERRKWLEKQGEQKPAWSEEDENILSDIIKDLVHPWNEYIPDRIEDEIKWLKNKLKSLRPQSTWKPSDKQINAIRLARSFVTDDFGANPTLSDTLKELEEQLKKLK